MHWKTSARGWPRRKKANNEKPMNPDEAYTRLMDLEGVSLTDHPMDPGGKTKFGISELGYPNEDIAGMTVERAKKLYYRDYWLPLRLNDLKDDLRFEMFHIERHC